MSLLLNLLQKLGGLGGPLRLIDVWQPSGELGRVDVPEAQFLFFYKRSLKQKQEFRIKYCK